MQTIPETFYTFNKRKLYSNEENHKKYCPKYQRKLKGFSCSSNCIF